MAIRETTSRQTRTKPQTVPVSASVRRISSSAMLGEAAERMERLGLDSLPVVENNTIVGRIAKTDVTQAVAAGRDPATTPVKYAMRVEE